MTSDAATLIHFGTSSWAFEGWKGIVYFKDYPTNKFKSECLEEYAADGRFSTVGMDLFFYQPPGEALLAQYAKQLPEAFKACCKVWEQLTIYRFPNHRRYGEYKAELNANFLNSELFIDKIINPHRKAFKEHTGPFIFEFQYIKQSDRSVAEFVADLDRFFSKLPSEFPYSVEIRNKNFLNSDYFNVLKKHGAAHVFNHWSYMPRISEQLKYDSITSDFCVARLLTPIGMGYQESATTFEPFNELKQPAYDMREDVMRLIDIAVSNKVHLFLLFNNRVEGCAPLTIDEIRKMMAE
ncbi:DUF72 domain-containing protein [candidate division KSB1 bacterium]|nr:DUF72 domain-containing protein [candidate division KSB1 bacterium]